MSFWRQRDVIKSFFEAVKTRFEDVGNAGRVLYFDRLADPTGMNAGDTPLSWWVELRVVSAGARRRQPTLFQVDVVYQIGDESDQATMDRYGDKAAEKADEFLEKVFAPNDSALPLYDFSTPASPSATGHCLIGLTSEGMFGEPNDRRQVDELDNGLVREIMTVPVWLDEDLSRMSTYR